MGSGIKGFKSQKILKSKINGYTETESIDIERYATVQELTGDKHGVDVVVHGSFKVNTLVCTAEAGSNIRVIKFTAHGALKGDHIRFVDSGIEASILSVPSANELILGSELTFDPTGLDFDIFRHITPKYAKDGGLQVSQGPIQYNDNQVGTPVEVTMDTAVPANIKALPTELIFKKDGVNKRVSYDSTTPTNSDAIPVNIVTVNGTGIQTTVDLTGAQVNVQLSHNASNPDSVQIGDGTNLLAVNTNKEAKVNDADAIAQLTAINANTDAIETKLDTLNGKDFATQTTLAALLAELQLKADLTETQPVSVQNTNLDIRDLVFTTDKVDVSGSSVTVSGTATVSATDLDIRDLSFTTDKVDVSGSSVTVSGTATVSATDLDIRNLSFAQDTVDVSGSTVAISGTVPVAQVSVGALFYENNALSAATNAFSGSTIKKVYIQADSDNTDAIRFKLTTTGAAASPTSGWKLLPGADIALELGGGSLNTTLSICPVSGTQKVVVQYA